MAKALPWDLLGLSISGDIAGYTLYQDRYRRTTAFPASPPEMPATPNQVVQRALFAAAVENWKTASLATREAWETASLLASVMMTGHNLWVHFSFSQDAAALRTLVAQTGVALELPPDVRNPFTPRTFNLSYFVDWEHSPSYSFGYPLLTELSPGRFFAAELNGQVNLNWNAYIPPASSDYYVTLDYIHPSGEGHVETIHVPYVSPPPTVYRVWAEHLDPPQECMSIDCESSEI